MAEGMTPNFNAFNWAPIWKSFNFTPMFFEIPSANFFWAGMIPSVWLWLNLAFITLTTLMTKNSRTFEVLFYMLDVEEHPVRSIGFVAACIVTGIYGIGLGVKILVA